MIQQALIVSLQILAIHVIVQPGMIMEKPKALIASWFDQTFGLKWSKFIQKPLWSCLVCMSGIWTILLTVRFDLALIFIVCGMNALISKTILSDE